MDSYKNLKQANKKLVTRLEYREAELSGLVGDLSSKKSEVFEKEMCLNRELNQNLLLTDELAKSREVVRLKDMDIGQMTQTKKELKRASRENKQILVQSQKFENKLKMALERENVYKERMSMYETSKAIFSDNKKYLEDKISELEVELDGYKTENESLIKKHSDIFKKLDSKESDVSKLINVLSNNSEILTQKNFGDYTPQENSMLQENFNFPIKREGSHYESNDTSLLIDRAQGFMANKVLSKVHSSQSGLLFNGDPGGVRRGSVSPIPYKLKSGLSSGYQVRIFGVYRLEFFRLQWR